MSSGWIDLHCHLDKLEAGVEPSLEQASLAGVHHVITIGTEPDDHPTVVALAKKYFPRVACTLGVHPHEASKFDDRVEAYMKAHLSEPFVVAVGEIGLDYYYNHSPRDQQLTAFRRQMEIAEAYTLPVQIHTRDAEEDTILILKEFKGRVSGVLHCFTGTQALAQAALDAGFNLSISGVVTFKGADELRAIVQLVPMDRLHVETDSPFLAPVPLRGRPNTPAFMVHTAERIADLKGLSIEEVREGAWANAKRIFPKLQLS